MAENLRYRNTIPAQGIPVPATEFKLEVLKWFTSDKLASYTVRSCQGWFHVDAIRCGRCWTCQFAEWVAKQQVF